MAKKRILSGIQPTGTPHIGNYSGLFKQVLDLQASYETFVCVVDLHSLTIDIDAKELRQNSIDVVKWLVAFGVDPKKTVLFIQSDLGGLHTELAWVFSTLTKIAELERMTQFKDKAKQHRHNINVGLLTYPVLQAADIALYNADCVPVGEDQVQHIELARDIIRAAKKAGAKKLQIPKAVVPKVGARIMGLDNPANKMSKSAESESNYLSFMDDEKTLRKKIQRAVTDSGTDITMQDDKPAVSNLLAIDHLATGRSINELESAYAGKGYGDFKQQVADHVVSFILPVQKKFNSISDREAEKILKHGKEKASDVASKTLTDVKRAFGLRG